MSAVQPVQRYSPSIAPHACPAPHVQPHTPQFATVVVSTALPPQQRAFESLVFQFVPSGRAAAAWHAPAEHFGAAWHASGAVPHVVPAAAFAGAPHAPIEHFGATWHASGAIPHAVPFAARSAGWHTPPRHTGAR